MLPNFQIPQWVWIYNSVSIKRNETRVPPNLNLTTKNTPERITVSKSYTYTWSLQDTSSLNMHTVYNKFYPGHIDDIRLTKQQWQKIEQNSTMAEVLI